MKLILVATVLAIMNGLSMGFDYEGYKATVLRLDRMGYHTNPEWEASRSSSGEARALNFSCDPANVSPSSSVPTSVHKLRPSDIKVVGAIGDSLTAANGAKAQLLTGLLTEYRGLSWSIGGDADYKSVVTLPNLLRRYNPTLKGFSLGTGSYTSSGAGFNVAQPGHTSNEMLAQAQELVKRIKADKNVDYSNDWKLITFFVGGNDLCKFCKDDNLYQPGRFNNNLRDTLDYFKANVPRALINMVLTLDVSGIEILSSGFVCKTMHNYLCECGITQANAVQLNSLVAAYQANTKNLVYSGRYDTSDDFTVVLQPFMEEMKPPQLANGNPDYSFFAPDCFHFSQKGHETAALELWNNMFQAVGKKTTVWSAVVGKVICPSNDAPFIYTNKNS